MALIDLAIKILEPSGKTIIKLVKHPKARQIRKANITYFTGKNGH